MISAVLFDFYGVFQPDPYIIWLKKHDLEPSKGFSNLVTQLDHNKIDRTAFLHHLGTALGRVVTYQEIYGSSPPALTEEVIKIATELKNNYRVGLLSNASRHLRPRLTEEGIIDLFDAITISSEVGISKPHPDIYITALAQLKAAPEQTLYIDDNPDYVTAARSLGVASIQFTDSTQLRNELSQYNLL